MATVILGAGIIGTATARYLSLTEEPGNIHLVDPAEELFSSASGFSGGFIAKDWFHGPALRLAELSFEEHRKLAAAHEGNKEWGYRTGTAFSYKPPPSDAKGRGKKPSRNWLIDGTSRAGAAEESSSSNAGTEEDTRRCCPWLRRHDGDDLECLGVDSVAQVDPLDLCRFLLKDCLHRGVRLHHPAKAISVQTDNRGELASIRIADTRSSTETGVPCTRVVIAAGAWSQRVYRTLFPLSWRTMPVQSLSGHSLVVRTPRWSVERAEDRCYAVFASEMDGYAPEAFSRADGLVFLAGLNDMDMRLPDLAGGAKAQIVAGSIGRLKETAVRMLGDGLEFVREALCFRPITFNGKPVISRLSDDDLGPGITTRPGAEGGVFLAAGHGPWGVSLSLGTGKVMAEMIQGRPSSIGGDIEGFSLSQVE